MLNYLLRYIKNLYNIVPDTNLSEDSIEKLSWLILLPSGTLSWCAANACWDTMGYLESWDTMGYLGSLYNTLNETKKLITMG